MREGAKRELGRNTWHVLVLRTILQRSEELQRERAQAARKEDENQHGPGGSCSQRIGRSSERISRTSEPIESPGRGHFRGPPLGYLRNKTPAQSAISDPDEGYRPHGMTGSDRPQTAR